MSPSCAAIAKLEARSTEADSLLCVGLDPELSRVPAQHLQQPYPLFSFCRSIIEATSPFACAFKPNTAFFEAHGAQGWAELAMVFQFLRESHPTLMTICDAKRGDIGNTNLGYVSAVFDSLGADAITLHPYLGQEALAPFLERTDRVSIVLCRTSNTGAGELQDETSEGKPLWHRVAEQVSTKWNTHGNCMLVAGATWPGELRRIREIAPDMPLLVPGIGAQGADLAASVHAGIRVDGKGLVLASSRAILYAKDPAAAARDTRDAINATREAVHGS